MFVSLSPPILNNEEVVFYKIKKLEEMKIILYMLF